MLNTVHGLIAMAWPLRTAMWLRFGGRGEACGGGEGGRVGGGFGLRAVERGGGGGGGGSQSPPVRDRIGQRSLRDVELLGGRVQHDR